MLNYIIPYLGNILEKNKMCKSNQMQILFDECIKLQDNLLDNIFLLSKCPNLVTLIEKNLMGDINASLLYVIKQLPEEIKISLLPNIIEIMKNLDGKTKLCQDIILSMNREWLKKIFGHILNMSSMIKIIKALEYLCIYLIL